MPTPPPAAARPDPAETLACILELAMDFAGMDPDALHDVTDATTLEALHLDSLDRMELAMHIEAALGVAIAYEWLDANLTPATTLRQLADHVHGLREGRG